MSEFEQSLREQNDVLRARIREALEANKRANLVIASMADEQASLTKSVLAITSMATIRHMASKQ